MKQSSPNSKKASTMPYIQTRCIDHNRPELTQVIQLQNRCRKRKNLSWLNEGQERHLLSRTPSWGNCWKCWTTELKLSSTTTFAAIANRLKTVFSPPLALTISWLDSYFTCQQSSRWMLQRLANQMSREQVSRSTHRPMWSETKWMHNGKSAIENSSTLPEF